MLVILRLKWPIPFGERYLHATKAFVDYNQPTVTFRHPNMQFSVPCFLDNPLKGFTNSTLPSSQLASSDSADSAKPQVGLTCLLTNALLPGQSTGSPAWAQPCHHVSNSKLSLHGIQRNQPIALVGRPRHSTWNKSSLWPI